jgi:DNA-binding NarL/FixJ family response regulator
VDRIMDKIVVMVIDKQEFFRTGVRQALSEQQDFELFDGTPDQNLMDLIETKSPDVLLLDIDYPSLGGLEIGRRITRHFPNTRVIMLTPNPDDEELFEVIKTGSVAANRPKIAEHVLKQFQAIVSMGKTMEAIAAPLTFRETQVLNYVAEGKSNKQIARNLEISEQTIKNHVSSILRKLNANDRAHAVALAIRSGRISAEPRPLE